MPYVADLSEEDGEREEAERLYCIAIDAGEVPEPGQLRKVAKLYGEVPEEHLLRYGLEADGTPALAVARTTQRTSPEGSRPCGLLQWLLCRSLRQP
ncbi:hypothetical protein CUT44_00710 [Streptomyces carminius]|uniref:Uncharacterized protein n=1 Tax=Streptomyces carminius TaxID=2665496 RepID=A0A2M8MCL2_9ACTN|nr:hypothetical protein CUT44_00710 [Streptomyces carminius]